MPICSKISTVYSFSKHHVQWTNERTDGQEHYASCQSRLTEAYKSIQHNKTYIDYILYTNIYHQLPSSSPVNIIYKQTIQYNSTCITSLTSADLQFTISESEKQKKITVHVHNLTDNARMLPINIHHYEYTTILTSLIHPRHTMLCKFVLND